ncbi:MAG: GNAT family N-acetyltransferase [Rhizobiaceae bacterium]|nr:MAG: GNAT family N-acetyltransferase [Rhizobiaceae bacterium]
MAITEAERPEQGNITISERVTKPELPLVRRFEAAGFRAWPAASVQYDGTWLIRLNAGYPAKRLNSVNPLDPGDTGDLDGRIKQAGRVFEACGRPLTFRLSPLSGEVVPRHLAACGWRTFGESAVMQMPLDESGVTHAIHQIPLRDVGRFITAAMHIKALDPALRPGLSEIVGSIRPETGLFVLEEGDEPVATAICVHDGDLAGFFEVATVAAERGKGHARRIVLSALKWAHSRGARKAWLQVEADNDAAWALYSSLGFSAAYSYRYARPDTEAG